MFVSHRIDQLLFPAKVRALNFMAAAAEAGIDMLVTCTVRDEESQNLLYAQGRNRAQLDAAKLYNVQPRAGRIITNAKGGDSFHNWRVALDVVPLRYGKPVWGTAGDGIDDDPSDDETDDLELWQRLGEIGESCGLEWAGRWKRFREFPHFQFTGGLTIADFRGGRTIPAELWTPVKEAA